MENERTVKHCQNLKLVIPQKELGVTLIMKELQVRSLKRDRSFFTEITASLSNTVLL